MLRNGNVRLPCRSFSPMSDIKFKKGIYLMSLLFLAPVTSLSPMSHVKFKKCSNRPVDVRGLGP